MVNGTQIDLTANNYNINTKIKVYKITMVREKINSAWEIMEGCMEEVKI